MKIAFYNLREHDELPMVREYSEKYGIDYVWTSESPTPDNLDLTKGCVAISCTPCLITEDWLQTFHDNGVRYLLGRSIGFDHFPPRKAKELGMRIANATYPTECVANYALMLILLTTRKYNETMQRAALNDFSLTNKMGREIGELTIGVLGTGHIGQILIRHLKPFGCRILAYDKYPSESVRDGATYVDLDTLYKESDVISVHMPSNKETFHFINREAIGKMKDGVILVNTARGPLIDTDDLIFALRSGKVGGAGLDVIEGEDGLVYYNHIGRNLTNDHLAILRSFPNVIVTPHMAFYVESTVRNMVEKSFLSVKLFSEGKENPSEVFPSIE